MRTLTARSSSNIKVKFNFLVEPILLWPRHLNLTLKVNLRIFRGTLRLVFYTTTVKFMYDLVNCSMTLCFWTSTTFNESDLIWDTIKIQGFNWFNNRFALLILEKSSFRFKKILFSFKKTGLTASNIYETRNILLSSACLKLLELTVNQSAWNVLLVLVDKDNFYKMVYE